MTTAHLDLKVTVKIEMQSAGPWVRELELLLFLMSSRRLWRNNLRSPKRVSSTTKSQCQQNNDSVSNSNTWTKLSFLRYLTVCDATLNNLPMSQSMSDRCTNKPIILIVVSLSVVSDHSSKQLYTRSSPEHTRICCFNTSTLAASMQWKNLIKGTVVLDVWNDFYLW